MDPLHRSGYFHEGPLKGRHQRRGEGCGRHAARTIRVAQEAPGRVRVRGEDVGPAAHARLARFVQSIHRRFQVLQTAVRCDGEER